MGDVGNRYDNFVAEKLNNISKIVFVLDNIFESVEQAKKAVFFFKEYLFIFYFLNHDNFFTISYYFWFYITS
jgi:hypothetical protein